MIIFIIDIARQTASIIQSTPYISTTLAHPYREALALTLEEQLSDSLATSYLTGSNIMHRPVDIIYRSIRYACIGSMACINPAMQTPSRHCAM